MATSVVHEQRSAFAAAVADLLRQSRRRQRLTQAEVADRTDGVVSKAALANYETGHRSLRIELFWAIVRALDEDPGALLAAAERNSGYGGDASQAPVNVDVAAIAASTDERLAPVRRWFALRTPRGTSAAQKTVTLEASALTALAELMGITGAETRRLLTDISAAGQHDAAPDNTSYPMPHAG